MTKAAISGLSLLIPFHLFTVLLLELRGSLLPGERVRHQTSDPYKSGEALWGLP